MMRIIIWIFRVIEAQKYFFTTNGTLSTGKIEV